MSDKIQEAKQHAYSGDGGGEVTGTTELLEIIVDGFGSDTVESVVVEKILETVTEDEDVEDVSGERVDELGLSTLDRVEVAVLDSDMVVGDVAGAEVGILVVNEVVVDVDDVKAVVDVDDVKAVVDVDDVNAVVDVNDVKVVVDVDDAKVVVDVDNAKVVVGREVVFAGVVEGVGRGVKEVIGGGEVTAVSEVETGVVTKGRTEVVG